MCLYRIFVGQNIAKKEPAMRESLYNCTKKIHSKFAQYCIYPNFVAINRKILSLVPSR